MVDSSLTVRDSIDVLGRTKTFELIVHGDSKFKGNVVANEEVKVKGELIAKSLLTVDSTAKFKEDIIVKGESKFDLMAKFKDDVVIDEELSVGGNSVFSGEVTLEGLTTTDDYTGKDILWIRPDGGVDRGLGGVEGLISVVYEPTFCHTGESEMPHWANGPYKLYTPCPDVYVGIATATPAYHLDVQGFTYAYRSVIGVEEEVDGSMLHVYANNPTSDLIRTGRKVGMAPLDYSFVVKNDGATIIDNIGTEPSLTIRNGSGHLFDFYNSTDDNILRLEDNGLLKARRIRVDLDTWGDYVFHTDYPLMDLKSTKMYIQTHGHLPGVPSAEEVTSNGIDVGEMQQTQMVKIEELYLHVIDMNEQLQQLQAEIERLKEENEQLKAKKQ